MKRKVRKIIESNFKSEKITALDVGAKGGVFQLPGLSKYTNYIGFEPNPDETDKIRSFKDAEYLPYALSGTTGSRELRITKHNSYSSFLEFDEDNFKKHLAKIIENKNSQNEENTTIAIGIYNHDEPFRPAK